jgi:hypothetical protein
MPLINFKVLSISSLAIGTFLGMVFLAGCASPPPPQVDRPAALSNDAMFDQGIQFAVDDLLAQALKTPGFQPQPKSGLNQMLSNSKPTQKSILIIDKAVDGRSGQQTAGTQLVDIRLLPLLKLSCHPMI